MPGGDMTFIDLLSFLISLLDAIRMFFEGQMMGDGGGLMLPF